MTNTRPHRAYFLAVDIWLMYIQPWSKQSKKGYEEKWRPYVVANYHFYTTLLILYLKSVKDFDISAYSTSESDLEVVKEHLERLRIVCDIFSSKGAGKIVIIF